MLIKVNRKELTKHISIVQKAISQRTTMQILEGIKITAKDNTLILTATDTEKNISQRQHPNSYCNRHRNKHKN